MLGPWLILYWTGKFTSVVPPIAQQLTLPFSSLGPISKWKLKSRCISLLQGAGTNFESVKKASCNKKKITIKKSHNIPLPPSISQVLFTWQLRHWLQNEDDDFTHLYTKSCRSERFNLNCPSAQLRRGWSKISSLKSLIYWLLGEILQYNLKKANLLLDVKT